MLCGTVFDQLFLGRQSANDLGVDLVAIGLFPIMLDNAVTGEVDRPGPVPLVNVIKRHLPGSSLRP